MNSILPPDGTQSIADSAADPTLAPAAPPPQPQAPAGPPPPGAIACQFADPSSPEGAACAVRMGAAQGELPGAAKVAAAILEFDRAFRESRRNSYDFRAR